MTAGQWGDKFSERLEEKNKILQEDRKSFQVYREHVTHLFDLIEEKVAPVSSILVTRSILARTEQYRKDVRGTLETIKSLQLKCATRIVEFVPDGINTPVGHGRIRVRTPSRQYGQFVFLYLVKNPKSEKPFPENLAWVIQDQKDGAEPTRCPMFDEEALEQLIEASFLED